MYVPASDERKVRKTAAISVDSLVFDLEDGVAINKKVRVSSLTTLTSHSLFRRLLGRLLVPP